jgi:hypothetical protein
MALAALIGSVLPTLPFIVGTSRACVPASIGIAVAAAAAIGRYRFVITYPNPFVVAAITVGL